LLVTYGTCVIKVTEGDDTQSFEVEGGETLLTALTQNGVKLSWSCGGKGTCGYCKVQVVSGAGPLLPTEEIFMSRAEKLRGVHLGCQVKVKTDMEIIIPDFLMTVREAVKHGRFDARKRWKFTVT
ncbi:MAG: 2Fe-2S iron-sulfur cluster binding domain-containing protein, partial [Spirochaetaceae bacterium]|nr:2Fe-2S iron-sulfur cluster binding domain-containing protein [Spirochaetaceae bacterium]